MTPDTRGPSRHSLWNDRALDGQHDWLAPAPEPVRPLRPEPPPAGPPGRDRGRPGRRGFLLGLVLIAALAGGGGALVGALDSGERERAAVTAPLPAASGRPGASATGAVYDSASKGVVSVQTRSGAGASSGTGFVIDKDGTIVTNAHVVGASRSVQVRLDDGEDPVPAQVLGTDASTDLAVLRVDPARSGPLHPLVFADSDSVRVGDAAIAIGFPLGLDKTATQGIVSGLGRSIEAPNGFSIDEVIQTDAPINPGNSGGPLLDARGRVIGVNSQIATAGGGNGNVGIGFAVPSNTVRQVVPRLAAGERIERPFLGVSTGPAAGGDGAEIGAVSAGGPAERSGLRVGDVIVAVAGRPVQEPADVAGAIVNRRPGDRVEIRVRRGAGETSISVELGTRPEQAP